MIAWKDVADTVQSFVTAAGIVVGGVFTYFKFIKDRVYRPRVALDLQGRLIEPTSGDCFLVCRATVENKGGSIFTLTTARLCASGFTTKSVRPPTSYTNKLKKLELGERAGGPHGMADGGTITAPNGTKRHHIPSNRRTSPRDNQRLRSRPSHQPRNRRPPRRAEEPLARRMGTARYPLPPSRRRRRIQGRHRNRLHREICAGTILLPQAQYEIATDGTAAR
jgi:hypothetical protein